MSDPARKTHSACDVKAKKVQISIELGSKEESPVKEEEQYYENTAFLGK